MDVPLETLLAYKYWLIYPLAIVEGPVLATFCGFLIKTGYLSFWGTYLVLILGDVSGDIIWYWLGYYYAAPFTKRFGKYFGITEKLVERITHAFRAHQNKVLFLSKLTMGFSFAPVVLFSAGMVRISFLKFLIINFIGQFIFTGVLVAIGYAFGNFYLQVNEALQTMSLISFAALVILAMWGFMRYVKSKKALDKIDP